MFCSAKSTNAKKCSYSMPIIALLREDETLFSLRVCHGKCAMFILGHLIILQSFIGIGLMDATRIIGFIA